MTHSSPVNAAAVEVLTRVDMETIRESMDARVLSLIRMASGAKPTAEEMDLIQQSGPQDFSAAADHVRRHAELELERGRMKLIDLITEYSNYPEETTETIVARMTPEDRETFFELTGAFL